MPDILKSRLMIILAVFGAAMTFLLGLFSRAQIGMLFFHSLLGALLLGALGFGLDLFLRQSLPAEDYNGLLKALGDPRADSANTPQAGGRLNILDQETQDENDYAGLYDTAETPTPQAQPKFPPRSSTPEINEEIPGSGSFEADDPDSIPRVRAVEENEADLLPRPPQPEIKEELEKVSQAKKEESLKTRNFTSAGGGDIKFKVGNKNVSADSKIIAKAIQTVLQRE